MFLGIVVTTLISCNADDGIDDSVSVFSIFPGLPDDRELIEGKLVRASFAVTTYSSEDYENNPGASFKWLRIEDINDPDNSSTAIPNATQLEYTITKDDIGFYIAVEVQVATESGDILKDLSPIEGPVKAEN